MSLLNAKGLCTCGSQAECCCACEFPMPLKCALCKDQHEASEGFHFLLPKEAVTVIPNEEHLRYFRRWFLHLKDSYKQLQSNFQAVSRCRYEAEAVYVQITQHLQSMMQNYQEQLSRLQDALRSVITQAISETKLHAAELNYQPQSALSQRIWNSYDQVISFNLISYQVNSALDQLGEVLHISVATNLPGLEELNLAPRVPLLSTLHIAQTRLESLRLEHFRLQDQLEGEEKAHQQERVKHEETQMALRVSQLSLESLRVESAAHTKELETEVTKCKAEREAWKEKFQLSEKELNEVKQRAVEAKQEITALKTGLQAMKEKYGAELRQKERAENALFKLQSEVAAKNEPISHPTSRQSLVQSRHNEETFNRAETDIRDDGRRSLIFPISRVRCEKCYCLLETCTCVSNGFPPRITSTTCYYCKKVLILYELSGSLCSAGEMQEVQDYGIPMQAMC